MFSQASVILSTGGGRLTDPFWADPPQGTHPRADTSSWIDTHTPWQTPLRADTPPGRHPPGLTHTPPWADTPQVDTPPRQTHIPSRQKHPTYPPPPPPLGVCILTESILIHHAIERDYGLFITK